MGREKAPVTSAVRFLRAAGVSFSDHLYSYQEKGGTAVSSRELGVDEHSVIKTLVMEDESGRGLIVLMHGDMMVSTRELARQIGVRQITPSTPEAAHKLTGYLVGGTSPFGTRQSLPVYLEGSIMELEKIYINGGKRGYLVGMDPSELARVLKPVSVNTAITPSASRKP